jgi:hypothetical protein
MATWAIWDIAGLFMTLFPVIFLIIYLFPRRQIKNLYIDAVLNSANPPYNKVILIELRNHTNTPIYLLSEGFKFGSKIKPSPFGAKNANTGIYEIKFEGRKEGKLTEIDTLIRPNQTISTWIPLDDDEPNEKIKEAITSRSIGILMLKALRVQTGRDAFVSLKIKV